MKLCGYVAGRFAKGLVFAGLAFLLTTNLRLFSQPRTVSLCVVDTRPDRVGPYDPPAGPFAIGMFQQLAGRKLKDSSELNVIVLPALKEPEILPEIHHLNCSWVLQLWYQRYGEADAFGQSEPRGAQVDSLYFRLWNGATGKVAESGGGFVSLRGLRLTPYASFRKEILKTLNHLR